MPFVDVWYSGLHQGPIDTEAPHGNALLGVAFTARGTFPWLGESMASLSDRIIALADALGDGALRLRERLLNTASLEDRFKCVERWLLARLKPRSIVHPAVRWAVDRIAARRAHVNRGSRHANGLHAQTSRQSLSAAGWPLSKSLARVHRFRGALALLNRADGQVPWTELADACGYYDQSHLINEFRRFTGLSPVELARRDRPTRAASYCDKWEEWKWGH